MGDALLIIVPIVVACLTVIGTFVAGRIQRSGTTKTSESGELWEESKAIRLELRAENIELKGKNVKLQEENLKLLQENFRLKEKLEDAYSQEPR